MKRKNTKKSELKEYYVEIPYKALVQGTIKAASELDAKKKFLEGFEAGLVRFDDRDIQLHSPTISKIRANLNENDL